VQAKGAQATIIDRLSELTGRLTAWLTLAMVLVTCLVVVLRYVFDIGFIWLQESVTWMHAVVFMLGAAYTLEREDHVRVDVFYRRFGERGRAVVDLLGVFLFLLPLCGWIGWSSWDFVATSWRIGEASRESGGLPYPLVPLLKSVLVVMPAALALQGLSLGLRSFRALSLEPGGER
jgi:TRAP-type mannitol/chloroaromatic compound transport system permease small subunit